MAATNLDHNHHYHLSSSVGAHYFNHCYPASNHHNKPAINSASYYSHDQQLANFSQQDSIETGLNNNLASQLSNNNEKPFLSDDMKQPDFEQQHAQNTSMIHRFIQCRPAATAAAAAESAARPKTFNQHLQQRQNIVCNADQVQLTQANVGGQQAYWTANNSPKSSTDSVQSGSTIQTPYQAGPIQMHARGGIGTSTIMSPAISQQQNQLQCLDNDLTTLVKIVKFVSTVIVILDSDSDCDVMRCVCVCRCVVWAD